MIESADPRVAALLDLARTYGVTVHRAVLHAGERGRYEASRSRILVARDLTTGQEVSTLAHEIVHARRGDDGHQPPAVERLVDEEAARLVITPTAYRRAEQIAGPDPWALARELDLSPSLIVAWQRLADRLPAVLAS